MEQDLNTIYPCEVGCKQMWTLTPSSSPKSGVEQADQSAGAESGPGLIRCRLIALDDIRSAAVAGR